MKVKTYKTVLYDKNNIELKKLLLGKKINNIDYSINIPLYDNSITINFTDGTYFVIYSIMRVINEGRIILCSADYYFNKKYIENKNIEFNIKYKEDSLIFKSLKQANKILKNEVINDIAVNDFGDLVLFIGPNIRIESYFDSSEKDKDYYTYFGNNNNFSFYREDSQLLVVEDYNDKK